LRESERERERGGGRREYRRHPESIVLDDRIPGCFRAGYFAAVISTDGAASRAR